jgi:hypothetical protein
MHGNQQASYRGTISAGVDCGVFCSEQGYHLMQIVWAQKRVSLGDRQIFVPNQVGHILE